MARIAMVGTRGVPARYGGFETAVEEVGRRLTARGHEVIVYCRCAEERLRHFHDMRLVHLPCLRRKTAETLSHTALSMLHVLAEQPDVVLLFNAANAPFLPLLRRGNVPVAVHVDGLEWKRGKWGPVGRRYYLTAERLAARWADALIADARGIQEYYSDTYGVPSRFIPYGAPIQLEPGTDRLAELGLTSRGYHLVVARWEPENNVDTIVAGFRQSSSDRPLVVVGSAPYADDYTARVHAAAAGDPRIQFAGGVYDQPLLDQLYANCLTYLHGHSVGGTNPSLLRAMGAGAPVIAKDVVFNREVLAETGEYFTDAAAVARAVNEAEATDRATMLRGRSGQFRAAELYNWDKVADDYERLCLDLAGEPLPAIPSMADAARTLVLDGPETTAVVPVPSGPLVTES